MDLLVTGSSGLIGSEVVAYFDPRARSVIGIDNNLRRDFFGPAGDTRWNLERLQRRTRHFTQQALDIRDRGALLQLMADLPALDLIVHCAGQPSHDLAARRPFDDFDVNAVGTLNLLEGCRRHHPGAVFVFLSTNKVYGDAPNRAALVETASRWDYADPAERAGITEACPIDGSKHSLFGVSKAAADLMVQEYGRYFGLKTVCLRAGCLTGPAHAGVELHGFLSYLVGCQLAGREYTVLGFKGKQVRDNLHSLDVATIIEAIIQGPRPGEVYNIGGERRNACSILEAFEAVAARCGRAMRWRYQDAPREGDHICYISDMGKFRAHYPQWRPQKDLDAIFDELLAAWRERGDASSQSS